MKSNVSASGAVAPVNNVTNAIPADSPNSVSLSTTVHGYQAPSTALYTASVFQNITSNNTFQLDMPSTVPSTSSTSIGTVSTNNAFQLDTPSTTSSSTASTMPSLPHTHMSQPGAAHSIPNLQMMSTIPGPTPDAQLSASNAFGSVPPADIPSPSAQVSSASNTHFIAGTVPSTTSNISASNAFESVPPADIPTGPSAQVSSVSNTHFISDTVPSTATPSNVQAKPHSSLPTTASGATSLTLSTDINKDASGSQLTGPPPHKSAKKSEAKKRGRKPTELVIDPSATGAKYVLLHKTTRFLTHAHFKENYSG